MEISPEQLTGFIAIGFGLVRITEVAVTKGFQFVTGKKDITSTVEKLGNNHISHLQKSIEDGFSMLGKKLDEQSGNSKIMNESIIKFMAIMEERTKKL